MKALLEKAGFFPCGTEGSSERTRERINLGVIWFMVIGLVLAKVGII
jgi:hypothetical protein